MGREPSEPVRVLWSGWVVDADMGCALPTQAYMSHMNKALIERAADENPWDFQFTRNLASSDSFEDTGPSVVLASPGMLQNGVSRNLFERWCEDPKNCVIIAGYSVEGTLARDILSNPSEITSMEGRKLRLNAAVHNVSFSGTLRLPLAPLLHPPGSPIHARPTWRGRDASLPIYPDMTYCHCGVLLLYNRSPR